MFPLTTRILVVDDMPSIRELVKSHLRTMGYTSVSEAVDGRAGFEFLAKQIEVGDPIQLVISDWNMPNMTGLEFLKKVRATPALLGLPFVLLTSEAEREQVTEAVLAGVSQYIVKPFAGKVFEEKLKGAWAKHGTKT